MTLFLIAEANSDVGYGHLGEIRAVARALEPRGVPMRQIAIGDVAGVESVRDFNAISALLRSHAPRAIVWSVRTKGWREIWRNLPATTRHVWIADVADDYPNVDALIVPTLDPRWRDGGSRTHVFVGPEYFPLDVRGPREIPPVATRPRDVLLTLGGADRTEASLRIVPALEGTRSTVVIGPGFRHAAQVRHAASAAGIESAPAPDGLRELLVQHRIVISAGGNTLFEAAAAGTPALVAWEDPHEEAQGKSFEQRGTALVLGRGAAIEIDRLRSALAQISSKLETMSAAGPRLIDGRGAERIADLLIELAHGAAA